MSEKVISWETARSIFKLPMAKHALLVIVLLIPIIAFYYHYEKEGETIANMWLSDLKNVPTAGKKLEVSFKPLKGTDVEKIRATEQISEIKFRAGHHINVMKHFYTRYYMLIILATYSGIIAAIFLLIIMKSGWDNINKYFVTAFLVMAGTAIISSAFIKVFNLEKNISDNKALYIQYVALENEVISYFVTGEDLAGKNRKLNQFIHYIDQQLAKLNTLAVGFDASQIPDYKKVVKDLQQ